MIKNFGQIINAIGQLTGNEGFVNDGQTQELPEVTVTPENKGIFNIRENRQNRELGEMVKKYWWLGALLAVYFLFFNKKGSSYRKRGKRRMSNMYSKMRRRYAY